VDGGFAIWDPARNYWRENGSDRVEERKTPSAYQFNRTQLWKGLWRTDKDEYEKNRDALVCRGLLEDVVSWQFDPSEKESRELMENVVAGLSPDSSSHVLRLGDPMEVPGRPGKVPTLRVPYSENSIPLEQASAGIRRIVGLAYALVWAWTNHQRAVRAARGKATSAHQIVLLVDEIEAHLHPQWQRRILPSLREVIQSLGGAMPAQVLVSTHAPLVLASAETKFDPASDLLMNFDLSPEGRVRVQDVPWARHGDVISWLESEAFDLPKAYNVPAEAAIRRAEAWLASSSRDLSDMRKIGHELFATLPGDDPFLIDWLAATRPEALLGAAKVRKSLSK
jgi:hypothetical protein